MLPISTLILQSLLSCHQVLLTLVNDVHKIVIRGQLIIVNSCALGSSPVLFFSYLGQLLIALPLHLVLFFLFELVPLQFLFFLLFAVRDHLGLLHAVLDVLFSGLLAKLSQALRALDAREHLRARFQVTLRHLLLRDLFGTRFALFFDLGEGWTDSLLIIIYILTRSLGTSQTSHHLNASTNQRLRSLPLGRAVLLCSIVLAIVSVGHHWQIVEAISPPMISRKATDRPVKRSLLALVLNVLLQR